MMPKRPAPSRDGQAGANPLRLRSYSADDLEPFGGRGTALELDVAPGLAAVMKHTFVQFEPEQLSTAKNPWRRFLASSGSTLPREADGSDTSRARNTGDRRSRTFNSRFRSFSAGDFERYGSAGDKLGMASLDGASAVVKNTFIDLEHESAHSAINSWRRYLAREDPSVKDFKFPEQHSHVDLPTRIEVSTSSPKQVKTTKPIALSLASLVATEPAELGASTSPRKVAIPEPVGRLPVSLAIAEQTQALAAFLTAHVPRSKEQTRHKSTGKAERNQQEWTTLLVKHLSENCTGAIFCNFLDSIGLKACYDFIYVPRDIQTGFAFGFAFINMVSHGLAVLAMQLLNGHTACLRSDNSKTGLEVCWSEVHQGLHAQLQRYRNSPLMHESVSPEFRPLYFQSGLPQPFPEPTRVLEPPELKPPRKLKFLKKARASS